MELWIISQSKETLMKVTKVHICDGIIFANGYTEFDERIGEYATKERALEVLDDINKVKWWKYMAELDFGAFVKILNETYNNEEILRLEEGFIRLGFEREEKELKCEVENAQSHLDMHKDHFRWQHEDLDERRKAFRSVRDRFPKVTEENYIERL